MRGFYQQHLDHLEWFEQGDELGRQFNDMFPEHEQILRLGSNAVHEMLSTQILRLAPATVHDMLSAQFLRLASATINQLSPVRKRVKALGARYELVFNYKREILGRLKSGQRCYICLCIIPGMLHTHIAEWGLKWCPACFKKYTVGKLPLVTHCLEEARTNILEVAKTVFEREYRHVMALATPARRTSSTRRRIYLRPELDHIVRGFLGINLLTHWMQPRQMKQRAKYMRVENSILEQERFQIRLKLVRYAEMIWEGRDPCFEMAMENSTTTPELRVNWSITPDTFRAYRERFAPTSKIARFLFPGHLITDDPTNTPCTESGGWLRDPVRALTRGTTGDKLEGIWFADAALGMIELLVNWNVAKYNMKGKGGYVDEWVKAAKSYHIHRLEDELKKGVVVGITHAPKHEHGEEYFSRIRKLRAKCGLHQEGEIFMPKLPARIPVWNSDYSDAEYAREDSAAAKAIAKRNEKIKYFNKIMRDTCIVCPETGLKLNQIGLEELVNHMHLCHPDRFWEKDDWHIIG